MTQHQILFAPLFTEQLVFALRDDDVFVTKDTDLYPTFNDLLYYKDKIEQFRPDRKNYTRSLYADKYLNPDNSFKTKEELRESLCSMLIHTPRMRVTKEDIYQNPDKNFYLGRRPKIQDSKIPNAGWGFAFTEVAESASLTRRMYLDFEISSRHIISRDVGLDDKYLKYIMDNCHKNLLRLQLVPRRTSGNKKSRDGLKNRKQILRQKEYYRRITNIVIYELQNLCDYITDWRLIKQSELASEPYVRWIIKKAKTPKGLQIPEYLFCIISSFIDYTPKRVIYCESEPNNYQLVEMKNYPIKMIADEIDPSKPRWGRRDYFLQETLSPKLEWKRSLDHYYEGTIGYDVTWRNT